MPTAPGDTREGRDVPSPVAEVKTEPSGLPPSPLLAITVGRFPRGPRPGVFGGSLDASLWFTQTVVSSHLGPRLGRMWSRPSPLPGGRPRGCSEPAGRLIASRGCWRRHAACARQRRRDGPARPLVRLLGLQRGAAAVLRGSALGGSGTRRLHQDEASRPACGSEPLTALWCDGWTGSGRPSALVRVVVVQASACHEVRTVCRGI
jgi:hypothetical protein